MRKSKLELVLNFLEHYLDKHFWESRILATGIAIGFVRTDFLTIIHYFIK